MATSALSGEVVAPPQKGSNPRRRTPASRSPFLDVDEVAEWLGVETGFVRRLIAQHRIPFVRIGRFVRFDSEEVAAWIDDHRVRPVSREEGQ